MFPATVNSSIIPMRSKSQQNPGRARIIGNRLRKSRKQQRLSQTQLAEMTGTSCSQISGVEHDQSGTSLCTAIALSRALKVSLDYLVGQVDEPTPTREIACDLKAKIARIRDLEEGHAELLDPNWHEHVGIDEVDTTVGADSTAGDEKITRRLKFPYPWLRRHGLRAHMCRIVRVAGEAMEPTVPDGSAILVDAGSTERRDGRIFVVRIRDELLVRRLVQDPEAGWLLFSDHPDKAARPTVPWPEEATIVGEVKWLGRTFT